jgi:hypothetical protein
MGELLNEVGHLSYPIGRMSGKKGIQHAQRIGLVEPQGSCRFLTPVAVEHLHKGAHGGPSREIA